MNKKPDFKYEVVAERRFSKDIAILKKSGYNIELLQEPIFLLAMGLPLPEKYRDHKLTGKWKDFRECHININWILVYAIHQDVLELRLTRTGTHAKVLGL